MTQTFTEYVCWKRSDVEGTVNTEAVHADEAVFLATHRPLVMVREDWGSPDAGERVDEHQVLDDFTHRRPVGGVVLMPVVGESGTGKSHLVRWVGLHMPNTTKRRVIYLRKTETNLSSVIEALLADLDDPKFEDVRNRVSRSIGQYEERRLPHELLDRLALAVQFAGPPHHPLTDEQARIRSALVKERGLPTLLRDYEYRQHLLAPDGFLARFAAELRRGRRGGEGERPTAFNADDLLVDVDGTEIGPVASVIYRNLMARPDLREEAARLLTANLDGAVLRLTDLDGGQLAETMLEIRREFHRRGQEIVLLIEDFALIQGIQGDLLDAICEAGVREGRQDMATIRTLMAVTPGYFESLLETVRTRIAASVPHVYKLDVPISDDLDAVGVGDQQVVDFVARYLNAARTGAAALARAYEDADGPADWVPNACVPCPFRQECHEAFGESSEGFGLYPYNRSAVLRTVRVSSGRDAVGFNPRRILSRVVRKVLDNYDTAIRDGAFPPRAFQQDFPRSFLAETLKSEPAAAILAADPENYERRIALLEFWGDPAAGVTNLAAGIHEAFRLPPLPQQPPGPAVPAPAARAVTPAARADIPATPGESAAPASLAAPAATASPASSSPATASAASGPSASPALQMKIDQIDAWYSRNHPLQQDLARNLRTWLREAVVARVPWHELGLPRPTDSLRKAVLRDGDGNRDKYGTAVTIEAAFGEKDAPPPGKATIKIERGPDTATMFKAIFRRVEYGHWNFPGGPAQQRLLSRRLDEWAASMVEVMREHFGLHRPETIEAAVEASLLGAQMLDLPGSQTPDRESLLTVLFDPGPGEKTGGATHEDADVRAPEWTRLAARHRGVRGALVARLRQAVGAAQGSGGEQLVDATVLLPAVDAFVGTWRLGVSSEALPEWVDTAHGHLRREFDPALRAQWKKLLDIAAEYRRLTGDAGPDVLLQELEESLTAMIRVVGGDAEMWVEGLRQARKYPWVEWQRLTGELREPDSTGATVPTGEVAYIRRLRVAAADRGKPFAAVLRFLRECEQWLDEGLRKTEIKRTAPAADPLPELRRVLTEIGTLLDTWGEARNG